MAVESDSTIAALDKETHDKSKRVYTEDQKIRRRAADRARYLANPDHAKATAAAWRAANPRRAKANREKWLKANADAYRAKRAASRKENKDAANARSAAWAAANRDRSNATKAAWAKANPERVRAAQEAWLARNIEKERARKVKYQVHRVKSDPAYRILVRCRIRLYQVVCAAGARKGDRTLNLIGCSLSELRTHIEARFHVGMTWENYGKTWHVDHRTPVSAYDMRDPEQQRAAFHYTNLQPLFAADNRSKGARLDWRPDNIAA